MFIGSRALGCLVMAFALFMLLAGLAGGLDGCSGPNREAETARHNADKAEAEAEEARAKADEAEAKRQEAEAIAQQIIAEAKGEAELIMADAYADLIQAYTESGTSAIEADRMRAHPEQWFVKLGGWIVDALKILAILAVLILLLSGAGHLLSRFAGQGQKERDLPSEPAPSKPKLIV